MSPQPARSVLLDNEAVQALLDPRHRKHRRAIATMQAVASRNRRRPATTTVVVPTAVRVEAGWDRRAADAAPANRLRVADAPLDTRGADRAADVVRALGVSVADAHLAIALADAPVPAAVLTSDVDDLRRIAAHLALDAAIVAL